MHPAKRVTIAVLSVAWLVPVSVAFFAVWDFQWRVLSPMILFDDHHGLTPFHPIKYAGLLYGIGAAWLAVVIIGWSLYLTRRRV